MESRAHDIGVQRGWIWRRPRVGCGVQAIAGRWPFGSGYWFSTESTYGFTPGPHGQVPLPMQFGSMAAICAGLSVTDCVTPLEVCGYWIFPARIEAVGTV